MSPIYGGSVLDPVINYIKINDTSKEEQRTELGNTLRQDIALAYYNHKPLKYYVIQNVYIHEKEDHALFVDVYLLTT